MTGDLKSLSISVPSAKAKEAAPLIPRRPPSDNTARLAIEEHNPDALKKYFKWAEPLRSVDKDAFAQIDEVAKEASGTSDATLTRQMENNIVNMYHMVHRGWSSGVQAAEVGMHEAAEVPDHARPPYDDIWIRPILPVLWRFSWRPLPETLTEFEEAASALLADTAHLVDLPDKATVVLLCRVGNGIVGLEVRDGKLVHRIWEDVKGIVEEAEIIYMLGNDAVACDKVSLYHIFKDCKARFLVWGHGNAKHEPVYEVRSFQKWLKMLRGKKSWRGVFGRGASKGEARRLLTAASNQFTTNGVRRFDFVRKLIQKAKKIIFKADDEGDNDGATGPNPAPPQLLFSEPLIDERDPSGRLTKVMHMRVISRGVKRPASDNDSSQDLSDRRNRCSLGHRKCAESGKYTWRKPGEARETWQLRHWLEAHRSKKGDKDDDCPASGWEPCRTWRGMALRTKATIIKHMRECHNRS